MEPLWSVIVGLWGVIEGSWRGGRRKFGGLGHVLGVVFSFCCDSGVVGLEGLYC